MHLVLPIARAAWPNSPCGGREVVHLGADREMDAFDEIDPIAPDLIIPARARSSSCEVWVRSLPPGHPVGLCDIITHEFGHLAGYPHADEPGPHPQAIPQATVMDPTRGHYSPCETSWPPPDPRDRAGVVEEDLWSHLPMRFTWVVRCRPGRCVARSSSLRTRIYTYEPAEARYFNGPRFS